METATGDRIEKCSNCGLPLPLRLPRPDEAAASWRCSYCNALFHAVLIDDCAPEILDNVNPARDVNPRMVVGGQVVATMHKRAGRLGRVFDERKSGRLSADFALTVFAGEDEVHVETVDLSAGGFGFLCRKQIDPGTAIVARFHTLPGQPKTKCVVRSCVKNEDGQFRIGAEFAPQGSGE